MSAVVAPALPAVLADLVSRLPHPLTGHVPGAWISHGCRTLSWGPLEAGKAHGNAYAMAWVEVTERNPWRGEPLWLRGERRVGDAGAARQPFTDKGREKLHAEVVPVIARLGFDAVWQAAYGHRVGSAERLMGSDVERAREAAVEARRQAAWFDAQAELYQLAADQQFELAPLVDRSDGRRHPTVNVLHAGGRSDWSEPVARVLVGPGEHVGWLVGSSTLVPLFPDAP